MQTVPTNNNGVCKEVIIAFVLLFSAAVLRSCTALAPGIIVPDGITYINTAKMITAGRWQGIHDFGVFSLYPFLIVLFQRLFSDWEVAARFISILFGSLAVIPFYMIVRRFFDLKIAIVAAVFFVISPRLVEYSSNVLREPVFWFFSLAGLCCALEGLYRRQWWFMVLSAFFVGLSAFTRMEGLAVAIIIMSWIPCHYWMQKNMTVKRLLVFLFIFIFSFPVLFFSPLLFLKNRIGQWEFGHIGSKIPIILKAGNKKAEQTFQQNIDESDAITKALSSNSYLVFLWQAIYKFFRSFHVLFIVLFIIGIIRRKAITYRPEEVLLVLWWLVFFLVSLVYISRTYYLSTRHGMLMGLPALAWVSVGFFEFLDILKKKVAKYGSFKKWKDKLPITLLLLSCAIILPNTLSWSGSDKIEIKKAGIYLRERGYSKHKFAVEPRLARLAFYADAHFSTIDGNIESSEMAEFLRSKDADLLVVDKGTMGRPVKMFLQDPQGSLEKIAVDEFERYEKYSFVLYRVKK